MQTRTVPTESDTERTELISHTMRAALIARRAALIPHTVHIDTKQVERRSAAQAGHVSVFRILYAGYVERYRLQPRGQDRRQFDEWLMQRPVTAAWNSEASKFQLLYTECRPDRVILREAANRMKWTEAW
jgi:hypothetical protein